MLKQRVLTALIALPLLFLALIFGPRFIVWALFAIFASFSVMEASTLLYGTFQKKLVGEQVALHDSYFWHWVCVIGGLVLFIGGTSENYFRVRETMALILVLAMGIGVFSSTSIDQGIAKIMALVLSIFYGALPWISIWDIYLMGEKAKFLFLTLAIVMGGDTGAYFGGRMFGKRLLAPTISPKKTWEGAFGGILTSVLFTLMMNSIFMGSIGSNPTLVFVAILGSISAIFGDLLESALKRFANVKDSGTLFPGHGGFLDRADSILFTAPVVWFILHILE